MPLPAYSDNSGVAHQFRGFAALPLVNFREATAGDVGNIAAIGGLLASDSTPALSGTGTTVSQQISWVAGNTDQVLIDVPLPEDFDGRDDALLELLVSSGTTDLASFTVLTSWDGAANVSDPATDSAASASFHKIYARIAASDIPDLCSTVSVALTPAAHATNPIVLKSARLLFTQRATNPS